MLLLKSLFHLFKFTLFYIINKKSIIPKIALIWQENQRYKRYFNEKNIKLSFSTQEKWFIRSMFISNPKAKKHFTLVFEETEEGEIKLRAKEEDSFETVLIFDQKIFFAP